MKYFSSLVLLILFSSNLCGEGFIAGTLVKTSNGYKCIEEINLNDLVICHDFNGSFVMRPVTDIIQKTTRQLLCIILENNEKIITSIDHKFYSPIKKSWINADKLVKDDVLLSYQRGCISVQEVVIIENEQCIYNISVLDYHNYVVSQSDILVHNFVFTVPIFTWVVGEGVTFFGGVTAASLGAACGALLARCFVEKVGEDLGATVDLGGPVDLAENQDTNQDFFARSDDWKDSKNDKKQGQEKKQENSEDKNKDNKKDEKQGKAPGKPTEKDGYKPPKKWDGKKVRHPKNGRIGWPDEKGEIWVPSGPNGDGGPHWDVQDPRKRNKYRNVYPGGLVRPGK